MERVGLIQSRVSSASCGSESWIKVMINNLNELNPHQSALVSSLGSLQFNLSLYWWITSGGRALVLTHPTFFKREHSQDRYRWFLDHSDVQVIPLESVCHSNFTKHKTDWRIIRDSLLVALSHRVICGKIRKNGQMDQLLKLSEQGVLRDENEQQRATYRKSTQMSLDSLVSVGVDSCSGLDEFVWHFTRDRHVPWPEEGWEVYCHDLLDDLGTAPYSALKVLIRILKEKMIRGSSLNIRGGKRAVCFTGAPVAQIVTLFTWQKHLQHLRFTPYGIGIRREAARELGVSDVIYVHVDEIDRLSNHDNIFHHSAGLSESDWTREQECRFPGNLSLENLRPRDVQVMVRYESERAAIGSWSVFPVASWEALCKI